LETEKVRSNYRVMSKGGELAIHEVFYAEDGSISGYTEVPVFPRAFSVEELAEELRNYAAALEREVLPYAPAA
jgi:hypothetical protein